MSTWTSRVLLTAAACGLAACEGGTDVGRRAPDSMTVAERTVVVGGPPGYCVDPSASRDGIKAFVLLGSCASIAGNPRQPSPGVPGMLTVIVSSDPATYLDVDASQDLLEAYFRSEAGRAALSREGRADTVEVLDVRRADGALYLRARDTSAGLLGGTEDEYWRAILDVNGRLVTVSVVGFEARPMSAEAGLRTLDATARRIRAESSRLTG